MTNIRETGRVGGAAGGYSTPAEDTTTVQVGETSLSQIAARLGILEEALRIANPQIADPKNVNPGQQINLPQEAAPVIPASASSEEAGSAQSSITSRLSNFKLDGQLRQLQLAEGLQETSHKAGAQPPSSDSQNVRAAVGMGDVQSTEARKEAEEAARIRENAKGTIASLYEMIEHDTKHPGYNYVGFVMGKLLADPVMGARTLAEIKNLDPFAYNFILAQLRKSLGTDFLSDKVQVSELKKMLNFLQEFKAMNRSDLVDQMYSQIAGVFANRFRNIEKLSPEDKELLNTIARSGLPQVKAEVARALSQDVSKHVDEAFGKMQKVENDLEHNKDSTEIFEKYDGKYDIVAKQQALAELLGDPSVTAYMMKNDPKTLQDSLNLLTESITKLEESYGFVFQELPPGMASVKQAFENIVKKNLGYLGNRAAEEFKNSPKGAVSYEALNAAKDLGRFLGRVVDARSKAMGNPAEGVKELAMYLGFGLQAMGIGGGILAKVAAAGGKWAIDRLAEAIVKDLQAGKQRDLGDFAGSHVEAALKQISERLNLSPEESKQLLTIVRDGIEIGMLHPNRP